MSTSASGGPNGTPVPSPTTFLETWVKVKGHVGFALDALLRLDQEIPAEMSDNMEAEYIMDQVTRASYQLNCAYMAIQSVQAWRREILADIEEAQLDDTTPGDHPPGMNGDGKGGAK